MSVEEKKIEEVAPVKRTYTRRTVKKENVPKTVVIEQPEVVEVKEEKKEKAVRKPRFEKGSEEAKEWSKKMREAKANKKALKAVA